LLSGLPAELEQQEIVHPPAQHQPARVELQSGERVGGWPARRVAAQVTEEQKSPGNWREDSEGIEQAVGALELALLVLQPVLSALKYSSMTHRPR
jgi:hypothetical protein